jgi:hypothetical protein
MRTLVSILAVSFLAAACAGSGASGSAAPSPTPSSSPKYAVEAGPDKLTLRLTDEGGFVAPGFLLTRLPRFALYGDGRVIVPGPVVAISPGPLLPNLRQLHVTPAEMQMIVAAADADGLLGPDATYTATNISDASTSVFTTIVDGGTHVISAYALSESGTGANATEAAARAKLQDFQAKILDLAGFLGRPVSDAESYQPTAMRVFLSSAQAPDPSGPTPQVVTWPLVADPASTGQATANDGVRCVALSGTDLTAFMAVARTANTLTIWTAASGRYAVSVRPLYPEESGCPSTAN